MIKQPIFEAATSSSHCSWRMIRPMSVHTFLKYAARDRLRLTFHFPYSSSPMQWACACNNTSALHSSQDPSMTCG